VGGAPTRRTGRKPQYVQYEDFRPALPPAFGRGDPQSTHRTPLSADVAAAVGRAAVGTPVNGIVEVAGPEEFQLDELVRETFSARNDSRAVVPDPTPGYFGAPLEATTLLPATDAHFAENRYADWLAQQK
jgi:uncharacterized protein YbjT (DUF2867 family)